MFFYYTCFYVETCFLSILTKCKQCFLHLSMLILNTQVCDGARCWLTLIMWCAKPPILLYPKVVVISSEPHRVRLLLGFFLYFTRFLKWIYYTVVIMTNILCALSYVQVFFTFFYCLVSTLEFLADLWFCLFCVWGGGREWSMFFWHFVGIKLTRISYSTSWFDPSNPLFSLPMCWQMTSVNGSVREVWGGELGLVLEEGEIKSNKKRDIYCQTPIKDWTSKMKSCPVAWKSTREIANYFIVIFFSLHS